MLKYLFKTAFRSYNKSRVVSIINVLGLSLGITVCLVIYKYISYELSFDDFNKQAEWVYRIERGSFASIAPSFIPPMKKDFAEIDKIGRTTVGWNANVKAGDKNFMQNNICFAEADIPDILQFHFIEGDPQTALNAGNVILTRSTAQKYFGSESAVGETLILDNDLPMTVSAIIEDYPENSHIDMDLIGSYLSLRDSDTKLEDDYYLGSNNLSDNVVMAYVRFKENTNIKNFEAKVPDFLNRNFPHRTDDQGADVLPETFINFDLRKVSDIHLHSHKWNEIKSNSDISYIYLFMGIAMLIVLIACINFFNLSTATMDKRFNEFGIKKVFGIKRRDIYLQFIAESVVLILISAVIAMGFNQLIDPLLRSFLQTDDQTQLVNSTSFIIGTAGLVAVLSIITGVVPARYFARKQITSMMKSKSSSDSGQASYRNALVIFQFVIAIGLFISIGVIWSQMRYIKNKDLGFSKENVIIIPVNEQIKSKWDVVRQQLLYDPDVLDVALSKSTIGGRLLDAPGGLSVHIEGEWKPAPQRVSHIRTDQYFFKTYGVTMAAGRDFDPNNTEDAERAFILNETAVRSFGVEYNNEVIGKSIRAGNRVGTIIGVAEDFHYESLHQPIVPMITYVAKDATYLASVRVTSATEKQSLAFIQSVFDQFIADYEFTYSHFEDRLAQQYNNESQMMQLISYASAFAIFIAGLGLLGLSLFMAERKTREIGVRKVNGAKIHQILTMLNADFIKWVAIAFVVACPFAWYAMHKWLGSFAYKTTISWWVFVVSGLAAMVIAVLTVSWQSWKAANKNPVEALRYE